MDNRLNKVRKQMSTLRADMLSAERVMRNQINRDRDCTNAANRVLEMRTRMAAMVREWKQLGGYAQLPAMDERLGKRAR